LALAELSLFFIVFRISVFGSFQVFNGIHWRLIDLPNVHQDLAKRFNLFKLWNFPSFQSFSETHANSVRALVCDTKIGADANTIDSLPNLEIVSTYSVGLDKIDLKKCKEKGIRVVNTPDVLTDDVADLAIALALAVFRKIPHSDGYVKNGLWKYSKYPSTTKVYPFLFFQLHSICLVP
jgi:lactate dehydrogenase-like 2-hydroxyacid dehydrogenase